MKYAKRIYRYRITASDIPAMPVGANIIDRKHTLEAGWTYISNGTFQYATGERIDRCCSECVVLGWGNQYGHEGEHGETAPRLPSLDAA
jgi:hypothetical protein